jgi:hypothetical protein
LKAEKGILFAWFNAIDLPYKGSSKNKKKLKSGEVS